MHPVLIDAAGHRRQPVTLPGITPAARPATGPELPSRPAHRREDHRSDAHRGRESRWGASARADRRAVASGVADRRSARARRHRPRRSPRGCACPPWQRRQASRGGDGQLGVGAARALAAAPRQVPGRPVVLRERRSLRNATEHHDRAAREPSHLGKSLRLSLQWCTDNTAIPAANASSVTGNASADALTAGAALAGRWASITSDGSTATARRSTGS
jgi:hypothetical protein